eukprot:scaffold221_cov122-Isochrysis_galbana.AAC.1
MPAPSGPQGDRPDTASRCIPQNSARPRIARGPKQRLGSAPIRLIQHDQPAAAQLKGGGRAQVVRQPAWRRNHQGRAFAQPRLLRLAPLPAHQRTRHQPGEWASQPAKRLESLHRELAGGDQH